MISIKEKEIKLDKSNIEEGWSLDSADFINQLLQRQASRRLGYKSGINEIKNHPWFQLYTYFNLKNLNKNFENSKNIQEEVHLIIFSFLYLFIFIYLFVFIYLYGAPLFTIFTLIKYHL